MANAIKLNVGVAQTFSEVGSVAMTLGSVANGAGRVSAVLDLGAAPRPYLYEIRPSLKFGAALTVGSTCQVYAKTSDGTTQEGSVIGTANAAVTNENFFSNCRLLGVLRVDGTASGDLQAASWVQPIYARYLQIGLFNTSGGTIVGTGTYQSYISVTPMWDEVQ